MKIMFYSCNWCNNIYKAKHILNTKMNMTHRYLKSQLNSKIEKFNLIEMGRQ